MLDAFSSRSNLRQLWLILFSLALWFPTQTAVAGPDYFGTGDGHSGPLVVGAGQNLVVNDYTGVASDVTAADTAIGVDDSSAFQAGDLILIWQAAGLPDPGAGNEQNTVDITTTNVGRYEFARVTSVDGMTDTLSVADPLTNSFAEAATQVVRVPEFSSVDVAATGSISAAPWDGDTGGIAVFMVSGTLVNAGQVSASGMGFRGGTDNGNSGTNGCTQLNVSATPSPTELSQTAQKGEGIVSTRFGTNHRARANVVNSGGGGVCHNSGGGGGGHAGPGGQGGRTWRGDPDPMDNTTGRDVGGLGGVALDYSPLARLTLGGGGGAGHQNNNQGGDGAAGGGVIFIRAGGISGAGSFSANGGDGFDSTGGGNDAAGAAGAGGAVVLLSAGDISCTSASATGGVGGSADFEDHGPGGGGGGGYVVLQSTNIACTPNVSGGAAGTQTDATDPNGPNYSAAAGGLGTTTSVDSAFPIDSDGDTLLDIDEGAPDTDGDGVPDYLDADDDNDGIPTATETGADADGDGIPNHQDRDSDNDAIPDVVEAGASDDGNGGLAGFTDNNNDGVDDVLAGTPLTPPNTDGTGPADFLDLDSDGDGLVDALENGLDVEADGTVAGFTDNNADGLHDTYPVVQPNTDGQDNPDYQDLDSDQDGLSDAIEAFDTDGDATQDILPLGNDHDGDGIDDQYDADCPAAMGCAGGSTQVDPNNLTAAQDSDQNGVGDWLETCVDGYLTAGEGCDDGDSDDTNACSNSCLLNLGEMCAADAECTSTVCDGGVCEVCRDDTMGGVDEGCSVANPICRPATAGGMNLCAVCADTDAGGGLDEGCAMGAPQCDESASTNVGACVGCTQDADCDDTNACTADTCDLGTSTCMNAAVPDGDPCLDGMTGTCDAMQVCVTGCMADADCDDTNPCTADSCDMGTGMCTNAAVPVGDPCLDGMTGTCDGTQTCVTTCMADADCNDTNPCTADSCDMGTGMCTNAAVPVGDPCLDGMMGTCDGTQTCVGVPACMPACTGATPVCDESQMPPACVQCLVDTDCAMGACNPQNTCVSCIDDQPDAGQDRGCTVAEPICEVNGGFRGCRACQDTAAAGLQDLGCNAGAPICATGAANPICVQCETTADCPAGQSCQGNNTCVPSCTTDTDCATFPAIPVCDTTNSVCVECLIDAACPATQRCENNACQVPDSDGDGVRDDADPDDDNDGLLDTAELAGRDLSIDTDNDGVADYLDADVVVCADADNDSLCDLLPPNVDADGDGVPNHLDLDSDGDGITDVVEANGSDLDGDARQDGVDGNANGLVASVDPSEGGTALSPPDTDLDTRRDYLDTDTDADGVPDAIEGFDSDADGEADVVASGVDSDGDGLDDAYDPPGGVMAPLPDRDGDTTPDFRDPDDDGDGLLSVDELGPDPMNPVDSDADGTPDYLDPLPGMDGGISDAGVNDAGDPSDASAPEADASAEDAGVSTPGDDAGTTAPEPDAGDVAPPSGEDASTPPTDIPDNSDDVPPFGLSGGAGCSAAPGPVHGAWWLAALLAAALWLTRRRRLQNLSLLAAGLASSIAASDVQAQEAGFNLNRYRPAESAPDQFQLSRPNDLGNGRVSVQLLLDYAKDPLVLEREQGSSDSEFASVVANQFVAHGTFAFGLADRVVLFAGVPVNLVMSGDDAAGVVSADGASPGDPWLGGRVRLVGENEDIFGLAFQAGLTIPMANLADDQQAYAGDSTVTGHPELLFEVRPDNVRITANIGSIIKSKTDLGSASSGSELTYALGFTLTPIEALDLMAELHGASAFGEFFEREETPLELLAGGKWHVDNGLTFGLAAGPGLTRGLGSPDVRVIGMVGWTTPVEAEPEPEPEPVVAKPSDRDEDGLLDPDDKCPDKAEDKDDFEDEDGCPDPDNDNDGVPDDADKCPLDAEDTDGFEDTDGCPEKDNDQDGIEDIEDECSEQPEDKDDFEDEDGCPDPDNDNDEVPDAEDDCPLVAGAVDNKGCPKKIRVEKAQIVILERVEFATNRDTILEASFDVLEEVRSVLKSAPHLKRLRVEGHTDSRGADASNLDLSKRRARSVVNWLTEAGIESSRLEAYGCGETRPIDSNTTNAGRQANRRVEFHVLDPAPGEVRSTDGCEPAD